jgi:hypothetical protein
LLICLIPTAVVGWLWFPPKATRRNFCYIEKIKRTNFFQDS